MKDFKGTKGPWEADYEGIGDHLISLENPNIDIWFDLPGGKTEFGIEKEEALANARLIASAPELLDIAQEALRMYEEIEPAGGWQHVHDGLKYAIKKATGE